MEIQSAVRDGRALLFIARGHCGQEILLPSPFQVVGDKSAMVWLRAGYAFHLDEMHGAIGA